MLYPLSTSAVHRFRHQHRNPTKGSKPTTEAIGAELSDAEHFEGAGYAQTTFPRVFRLSNPIVPRNRRIFVRSSSLFSSSSFAFATRLAC